MNATQELMALLAAHVGSDEAPASDYRLAKSYFNVSHQRVSHWRTGRHSFSDERVLEVCEALWPGDLSKAEYWLVRVTADRQQNVQVRKVWESIAKQVAAVVLALTAAGLDVRAHYQAVASSSHVSADPSIYYAQLRRLLRRLCRLCKSAGGIAAEPVMPA